MRSFCLLDDFRIQPRHVVVSLAAAVYRVEPLARPSRSRVLACLIPSESRNSRISRVNNIIDIISTSGAQMICYCDYLYGCPRVAGLALALMYIWCIHCCYFFHVHFLRWSF